MPSGAVDLNPMDSATGRSTRYGTAGQTTYIRITPSATR